MPKNHELDPSIRDVIEDQKRLAKGRSRQQSIIMRLARKALEAIKHCDARALTIALREAGVREGSEQWKNAWKAFHDVCHGP